jgi:hypothetical protein
MSRHHLLASAVFAALLPASGYAQAAPGAVEPPTAQAARREGTVRIDGVPDEPAWQAADLITGFIQNDPREGERATQPTEVRILFDDANLYVSAWLHDSEAVSTRLARRDVYMPDSDWFSVALDSYHDHLTAYRFMVNPSGVRGDEILSGGDADHGDDGWDPVWEVATRVGGDGWTVEMRIPFSQLRFDAEGGGVWGLQLERAVGRLQEEAVFAFTPKSERGGIARYGHLEGLRSLEEGGNLEILPYLVGRAEYIPVETPADVSFANPFRDGSEYFASAGLDFKYRMASNLTLDATVNPDFGQVELDPAVVNLTAYETRFDEKRPFFVEGADIFQFGDAGDWEGSTQLLYSRRIGGTPRGGGPQGAVYEDVPNAATILGAAKVTGRTVGGWSLGFLEAVTAREVGRFVDAGGGHQSEVVAPLTNYLVGRVRRSMREGQTVLGGMATGVHRRLGGLALASSLRAEAYSAGLDFTHEWGNRSWALSGYAAGSRIGGDPEAIVSAQRSSARYYQRPDADYLTLDPTATSLNGYVVSASLEKQAGLHWRGSLDAGATSPGFEVNDLGYQRDADRLSTGASVEYVENRPGDVFREWSVDVRADGSWNYGRDFLGVWMDAEIQGQLLSYWSGEIGLNHDFPGYDDRLTRGGPLTRSLASNEVSLRLESDDRKPWTVEADASYRWDEAGGDQYEVSLGLGLRTASSWNVTLGPELSRERPVAQYLGSIGDPSATRTYGRRYLFAGLDQVTLALEGRLNWTFQPGLTLEAYVQPFLASAAFEGVSELQAPRTFSFLRYGRDVGTVVREGSDLVIDPDGAGPAPSFRLDDEDFNERSLRGSAVLRWEWRPGSTLFLVWQHQRFDSAPLDDLSLGRDLHALFRAPSENVFVMKVSYWLSP